MSTVAIEPTGRDDIPAWLRMRRVLWPEASAEDHAGEVAALLAASASAAAFLARTDDGVCIGFAEATLRRDYVNGCGEPPTAFLEALYVEPAHRRRGVAGALVAAVEDWARGCGRRELASDASLDNLPSQQLHLALGFEETERVIFYRRAL